MAHITRISRVPWTKPQNLLGCKTPPPRGKRESLFATSETLANGQFEDASPGRHHSPLDGYFMQKEVAAQKDEGAAIGKEEHEDGTPTTLEAPRLARSADNGIIQLEDDSNAHNTCTPSNATTTRRTPQGSCGMEALLLAAEHAVSPNPYRNSKQRTPGTNDDFLKQQGLSHVVGQTIPESMSTWHWYSLNGSGHGHTPSTVADNKEELEWRDHDCDILPHTVTNGDEDTEYDDEEEEEEQDSYNSEGEDSSDNFDLYDQTVLVIQDGRPQYTVHRRPTPKKEEASTTSPDDDNDKDNTNSGFMSFEERLVQIENYKRTHGHLSKFTAEHKSLSSFISNERSKYHRGLLNPARAKRLRALKVPGFEMEPMNVAKEGAPNNKPNKKAKSGGKKAAKSNKKGGQTASSSRGKSKTSQVASTEPAPKRQRVARLPGRFAEDDKKKEASPAANNTLEKTPPKKKANRKSPPKKKFGKRGQPHLFVKWEERIVQLEKYLEENGHVSVPANKKKNADGELGRWLAAQRSLHRKRQLKDERVRELRRLKCDGF